MATVTTHWEDSHAFRKLIAFYPGGSPIKLDEIPPEDFVTPAETAEGRAPELSPDFGDHLSTLSTEH